MAVLTLAFKKCSQLVLAYMTGLPLIFVEKQSRLFKVIFEEFHDFSRLFFEKTEGSFSSKIFAIEIVSRKKSKKIS